MRRFGLPVVFAAALMVGCEDGPEQYFEPNTGDPTLQNGYAEDAPTWTQPGEKPFNTETGGSDVTGQAKFCDVEEQDLLIQQMVVKPILPDQSTGGIPIWDHDEDGNLIPLLADDLLGRPEDGKFCDSSAVYADAFIWGDDWDILVFFDQETRLVTDIVAYGNYQGVLAGTYQEDDGDDIQVTIRLRNYIEIDEQPLRNYPEWIEPEAVTAMYKMLRETHFPDLTPAPLGDSYNCLEDRKCRIIYRDDREHPEVAQDIQINFDDSGVILIIGTDGKTAVIYNQPVRVAPFEFNGTVDFDSSNNGVLDVSYTAMGGSCVLTTDNTMTWGDFYQDCAGSTDAERTNTVSRANYNVWAMRDFVTAEYGYVDVGFLRDLTTEFAGEPVPVLGEGESPGRLYDSSAGVYDNDTVSHFYYSLDLLAEMPQFDPVIIAEGYEARLEAMLFDSIAGNTCTGAPGECPAGWTCEARDRCESADGDVGALCGDLGSPRTDASCAPTWTCNTFNRCVDAGHPFADYSVEGADNVTLEGKYHDASAPQTLDTFVDATDGTPWVNVVYEAIRDDFHDMDPAEQEMVSDLDLSYPVYLVFPFVREVMEVLTLGYSEDADLISIGATDSKEFCIANGHFTVAGEPWRIMMQYSLNWQAVTVIEIDRGNNIADSIISAAQNQTYPELGAFVTGQGGFNTNCAAEDCSEPGALNCPCDATGNVCDAGCDCDADCDCDCDVSDQMCDANCPCDENCAYPACGCGFQIHRDKVDRRYNILTVNMWEKTGSNPDPYEEFGNWVTARVPGFVVADDTGYLRQIGPERWEFVPADKVYMYGKESTFVFYVQSPDLGGQVGKVIQYEFKGDVPLCDGPTTEVDAPYTSCSDALLVDEATCEAANCYWWDGACTDQLDLTVTINQRITDRIESWIETMEEHQAGSSLQNYRQCDLVFNYSVNGNILDSVASLKTRVAFGVSDDVAMTASAWR